MTHKHALHDNVTIVAQKAVWSNTKFNFMHGLSEFLQLSSLVKLTQTALWSEKYNGCMKWWIFALFGLT